MSDLKWPRPLDFSILFHPFTSVKLENAQCIWLNDSLCDGDSSEEDVIEARRIFTNTFAYMVPDGVTFDALAFNHADTKTMLAERYGGFGTGANGGGARCGALGPFQVKGSGKNPLAGPDQDVHHSYGGLKAAFAVHEALYASILEQLLPVGAARVLGVILTGPSGAYVLKDVERGWGALMVRDSVLRPANFMRARAFRPAPETRRILPSDVARGRRANVELFRLLGGAAGFDAYVKRFLRNSASQFAFARLARLSHGAVTASNICIDGRWLDLTNTTFSCASVNTGGDNPASPSYYEELYAPISIAQELIDTFAKYNGLELDGDWVAGFYRQHAAMFLSLHLPWLFGQPSRGIQDGSRPVLSHLRTTVIRMLSSGPTCYGRWPRELPADDPMLGFIEAMFLAAAGAADGRAALRERYGVPDADLAPMVAELQAVLGERHRARADACDWPTFVRASFVRALRQACLAEYFFKHRFGVAIDERLRAGRIDDLDRFMAASLALARWAFAAHEQDTLLFRGPRCEIRLRDHDGRLLLRSAAGDIEGNAGEMMALAAGLPEASLDIEGYRCAPYIERVLRGLARLDLALPAQGAGVATAVRAA